MLHTRAPARSRLTALLSFLVGMGASASAAAAPPALADTQWQLVSIQSMDDTQGTTHIADPSRFTLSFGSDGSVILRLDCNRGMGTWQAESAADRNSADDRGQLKFGAISTTRALCPPPRIDERIVRDLAYVRSYIVQEQHLTLSLMADGGIYEWQALPGTAPTPGAQKSHADRTRIPITLVSGKPLQIKGRIDGRQYVDYTFSAAAGQSVQINLSASHRASYVNLLPPDTADEAMATGASNDNHFNALLPTDGVYTLRVYLMRSAARRNESSRFTLSLKLSGKPLVPLSAAQDALVAGTHFHAQSDVQCAPPYAHPQQCRAGVIRRSHDGSATVELRWSNGGMRRILFVQGSPRVADTTSEMQATRDARGWLIRFNDDSYFDVPEALISGG